ncbi:S-layer homology domain-containing protein [Candidatus Kaiserbacteria bacterium]|nr:S-layer homology domain-containing protein [Candidatus Kaiserbacteria bacterium]
MKSYPLLSVASFILCLSVSGTPSALAANVTVWDEVSGRTMGLSDVPENAWFGAHVKAVSRAGIMQGYRDSRGWLTGKFGAANAVTRAEFLKMVAVMMVNRYDFDRTVVPTGARWYANYLAVVETKDPQLTEIMPIDDASLSQPILRHEAAGLLHLSLGNYPKNGVTADMWSQYQLFSDVTKDSPNAYAIAELKFYGVLSGDGSTGQFSPLRTLNRAEAAKMLVVTASAYQTPLGPISESSSAGMNGWKTYSNLNLGYSLSYPSSWEKWAGTNDPLDFRTQDNESISVSVADNPSKLGVLEWRKAEFPSSEGFEAVTYAHISGYANLGQGIVHLRLKDDKVLTLTCQNYSGPGSSKCVTSYNDFIELLSSIEVH